MSKTRSKAPNNTATRLKSRMVHVSKEFAPVNDPKTGLFSHFIALPGVTLDLGRNAQKRISRRASIKARLARRAA